MIKSIANGVKAYFKAFQIISKLNLWKYFIIPILISIITAVTIGVFSYSFSDNLGSYISNIWQWDFGKETFRVISNFISGILILIIGLLLYKHIVIAFSAPFMSPISEKIENYITGKNNKYTKSSFQQLLLRGIRLSLRNIFRELLLTIPILLLSIIPVVGFLFTMLLFIIQAYYAGFGNIDYTLERHFSYKESIIFVRKNKGLAIGNGIVFILFLLVPVIGIILVLPLSVTAATTETVKKITLNTSVK